MVYVYKPYDRFGQMSAPFDPTRCKASVTTNDRAAITYQCTRKPWKDGWCKQHHPDSEKKRQEEGIRRMRAKSPYIKLQQAYEQIASLRQARDDAVAQVEEMQGQISTLRGEVERLKGLLIEAGNTFDDHARDEYVPAWGLGRRYRTAALEGEG